MRRGRGQVLPLEIHDHRGPEIYLGRDPTTLGEHARPGLWMMGQLVDPARLVKDMERMGIQFEVRSEGGR